MYLLEPFPQQLLFASTITLRIASRAAADHAVRVTLGKKSQTILARCPPASRPAPHVFCHILPGGLLIHHAISAVFAFSLPGIWRGGNS
jgi:hypothetical protein